jgi:rhamnogalacturonyl hydrolase YesR
LINQQTNLINDSLTTTQNGQTPCQNDGTQNVWTYNQGVILGALCDMYDITGVTDYLDTAQQIAGALINNVADSNASPPQSGVDSQKILTELDQTNNETPSIDHCQFKGIFVRNLGYLYTKTHNPAYSSFLRRNAAAALTHTNSSNQFGSKWNQPIDQVDFIRQTSALDLLNAALRVQSLDLGLRTIVPDLSYLVPLLLSP